MRTDVGPMWGGECGALVMIERLGPVIRAESSNEARGNFGASARNKTTTEMHWPKSNLVCKSGLLAADYLSEPIRCDLRDLTEARPKSLGASWGACQVELTQRILRAICRKVGPLMRQLALQSWTPLRVGMMRHDVRQGDLTTTQPNMEFIPIRRWGKSTL